MTLPFKMDSKAGRKPFSDRVQEFARHISQSGVFIPSHLLMMKKEVMPTTLMHLKSYKGKTHFDWGSSQNHNAHVY
jgi:hypothetical protein